MKRFIYIISITFFSFLLINTVYAVDTSTEYNPVINPDDFTTEIDNPYFTLTPGKTVIYKNRQGDEEVLVKYIVTNEIKEVMGVKTLVVWDREWEDDELTEETWDWFAQDKDGNVWYFGEETMEYEDGEPTTSAGSWEAGVNGAKPGIIMKAVPTVGDSYFMEYAEGEALDTLDVLAINESVTTEYGTFKDCVKVKEGSALAKDLLDHKYYCSEVGGVAYVIDVRTGEEEEIIDISYDEKYMEKEDKSTTLPSQIGSVSNYSTLVIAFLLIILAVWGYKKISKKQ